MSELSCDMRHPIHWSLVIGQIKTHDLVRYLCVQLG